MDDEDGPSSSSAAQSTQLISPLFAYPGDENPLDIFICSEAGKPVYSFNKDRDEEFVVTLSGLIQGMVNFFSDAQSGEELRSITTLSGLKVTFSIKSPLILVLVTAVTSPVDPVLIINQVYAQIVSILTFKTLKSVFEQKPTYDLRRLLGGSEKLIDSLVDEGILKNQLSLRKKICYQPPDGSRHLPFLVSGYLTSLPNHLQSGLPASSTNTPFTPNSGLFFSKHLTSRCLTPVLPLNPQTRESVTNALAASVNSTPSSVLFALLFQRKLSQYACEVLPGNESVIKINPSNEIDLESNMLIAIHNNSPKQAKLNPLDIQLLTSLIAASEGQLASAESLWLPVCIPRVDSSAFIHGHFSYLSQSGNPTPESSPSKGTSALTQERLCLILLTVDREDFVRCQHIRDNLSERLNKVRIASATFSGLNVTCPHLDIFAFLSVKPHCIVYRNLPCVHLTSFHPLIHYVSWRMMSSGYKTFWLQSDDHGISLLGWQSPSFMVFFQFDALVTHVEAISAASNVIKWIKKEEDKIKLKDYQ